MSATLGALGGANLNSGLRLGADRSTQGGFAWLRSAASITPGPGFFGQVRAFEQVGRAALLVDSQSRVLEFNAHVRFGDGLHMSGGLLQAPLLADRQRLQRFLAAVLGAGERAASASATLTLPRPSGLRPWVIDGIDCSEVLPDLPHHSAALLLITDVERPARLSCELLIELFGLTVTEARLACGLGAGKSLQDVSAAIAISEGHARQRLKIVFNKTSTSRQGELIALLAKLG
jgi:DNA-binding CsgD family transcriptional regulator